jgi:hypothetical protein
VGRVSALPVVNFIFAFVAWGWLVGVLQSTILLGRKPLPPFEPKRLQSLFVLLVVGFGETEKVSCSVFDVPR